MKAHQIENQKSFNAMYDYSGTALETQSKEMEEVHNSKFQPVILDEPTHFANENHEEQIQESQEQNGSSDLFWGAFWCLGGIAVTVLTYSAAENGGTFIIAYGAIITGAIQFLKGLFNG